MSVDRKTLTERVMLTKYFMSFPAFYKLKRVKKCHVTYLASGKNIFHFQWQSGALAKVRCCAVIFLDQKELIVPW